MRRAVALDAPDIWFGSNLFEAWPEDIALSDFALSSRVGAAIAYDFIPALFPDLYLRDRHVRPLWEEQMKASAGADLLLAISDSTRADAIRLLGMTPDRIVNISGAADASFCARRRFAADQARRLRELGLVRDFVFARRATIRARTSTPPSRRSACCPRTFAPARCNSCCSCPSNRPGAGPFAMLRFGQA